MTIDINKIITKPWRGNSNGSLVILIPKAIVEKTQITTSSYVTIQGDNNGNLITIKKLDLERLV
jgi:antitoxin component of MazEF toxin-antitoxin module